jgi:hypothetical protein
MGTHGYGPLGRAVHGSVTTAVLDRADCPVLTGVRLEPRDDTFHMDRVVCSVNACVESQVPGGRRAWRRRSTPVCIWMRLRRALRHDSRGCVRARRALKADLLVIGRKHPHGRCEAA